MRGAAAFSAAIAGSFESSRRRTLRSSRSCSVGGSAVAVRLEVGRQLRDVGGPACGVTDRVQQDLDALEPGVAEDPHPELDDLGVDRRTGIADGLDVELPELAVASGLRPVVAEHRAGHREPDRLRPRVHAVLEVRPDDAGGGLRTERPRFGLLGSRLDPEELLLDDVGDLADAPLEDVGLLEHRRGDLAVAVARGEVRRQALEAVPGGPVGWEQVAGAPGGAWARHRAEVYRPGFGRRTGRTRSATSRGVVVVRLRLSRGTGTSRRMVPARSSLLAPRDRVAIRAPPGT